MQTQRDNGSSTSTNPGLVFDDRSAIAQKRAELDLEFEFACKKAEFQFGLDCKMETFHFELSTKRDEQEIKQIALVAREIAPLAAVFISEIGKAILTIEKAKMEMLEAAEERKAARKQIAMTNLLNAAIPLLEGIFSDEPKKVATKAAPTSAA